MRSMMAMMMMDLRGGSCVSQHVNMPKKGNIYVTNYAFNQTNKLIYSFCLHCKMQNENFPFYLTCKMKQKKQQTFTTLANMCEWSVPCGECELVLELPA